MKYFLSIIIILFALFCAIPAHAGIIFRPVFNSGLVGYWSFEEGSGTKVGDMSGNGNNGTWAGSGSHWTDGKFGKGGSFNGINDYVDCGTGASLNITSVITVGAWVYLSSAPTEIRYILGKRDGAEAYSIDINVNRGIRFSTFDGGNHILYTGDNVWPLNQWFHVVGTYDGTTLVIYINGINVASQYSPGSISTSPYSFAIGNIRGTTDYPGIYFPGLIDEVRVYNRDLSASEVSRLYTSGATKMFAAPKNGLVGYWSFEEGTGTKVGDFSNQGNTGTWYGSGSHWADGKFGKGGSFDGSSDYVDMGDVLDMRTGDYSVSVWFKTTDTQFTLVQKSLAASNPNRWFIIYGEETNVLKAAFTDAEGSAIQATWTTTTSILDNNWHHVVAVYDRDSLLTLYVDGVSRATADISSRNGADINISCSLRIGAYNDSDCSVYSSFKMNGSIDEVRIYNRALEISEITALYNSGLQKVNSSQNNQLTNGLVGLWSFNGPDIDGNEAYDRSGQGNTGTIYGAVPTRGKVGQALSFDGSKSANTYIEAGSGGAISEDWTISAYVNRRGLGDSESDANLIIQRGAYIPFPRNYELGIIRSTTKPYVSTSIDSWKRVIGTTSINVEGWYHITGVFIDATNTLKVYVNGVEENSATITSNPPTASQVITIGRSSQESDHYWNGLIDEVRIYNRALSAQEILRLYNLGH